MANGRRTAQDDPNQSIQQEVRTRHAEFDVDERNDEECGRQQADPRDFFLVNANNGRHNKQPATTNPTPRKSGDKTPSEM